MTSKLETAIESKTFSGLPRKYLSMSGIGNECYLAQWLSFRWASKPQEHTADKERIFRRGDLEEARIVADLKSVGVEVFRREGHEKFELNGLREEKQEELVGAFGGHELGHPDGRVLNVPDCHDIELTLEMKTMKDEKFQELKMNGVRFGFPGYYAQVQRYMFSMKTPAALFIATNKDNEERHYEFIAADKQEGADLFRRAEDIVLREVPFRPNPSHACAWCNHKEICKEGKAIEMNCRTCKFSKPIYGGKWICKANDGREISLEKQRAGCRFYQRII